MRFGGSPVRWVILVLLLLVLVPNLYHSATASSLEGGAIVQCDGNTGIDIDSNECYRWGEELLSGGLQLPASVEREDVSRIDIERAFFGFVDRCTANVSIESQASSELEVVVPCR